jgi:hypothetical protein
MKIIDSPDWQPVFIRENSSDLCHPPSAIRTNGFE